MKIKIPESEIKIRFSRSGGAGGQNVNKVETKVLARWDFRGSAILNDAQKHMLGKKLANHLDSNGELYAYSQAERTQEQNKKIAFEILNELVNKALIIPKKRKKTKLPKNIKEKRLKLKARHSFKKSLRRKLEE